MQFPEMRLSAENGDSNLRSMTLYGRIRNDSLAELSRLTLKVYFLRSDKTLVDTESVSVLLVPHLRAGEAKSFSEHLYPRGVPSEFTWSYAIEEATFWKDGHVY
jgi:hypothetical protein